MKIIEKELKLNNAIDILCELDEQNIDAKVDITIETNETLKLGKKFQQITIDEVADRDDAEEETDAEEHVKNDL